MILKSSLELLMLDFSGFSEMLTSKIVSHKALLELSTKWYNSFFSIFAIYQNVWLIVCSLQTVVHAAKLQIISQKLEEAILYTFSHPRKYVC